jgi:hypothetical protein
MADTRPASAAPDLDDTEVELAAERRLVHQVVLGALLAIPVGVVVCVGIVFVAVRVSGVAAGTPELMAVFVGGLFGVFFGALSGFVRNSDALDELDQHPGSAFVPHPSA